MTMKPYLCHITGRDGCYSQVIIEGVVELKKFLRQNQVHFGNDDLSYLENNSVNYVSKTGINYEIELLVSSNNIEIDSVIYLPMMDYLKKYSHCRDSVIKEIKLGILKSVKKNGQRYIEDKDFKKHEHKQHNI